MSKDYLEHKVCPLTESKRIVKLKGYERHFLVKSKPLNFVFCSRIPSTRELEKHYSSYDRKLEISDITRYRYQQLLDELEPYKKTGNLLDVGCGMGDFLEIANDRGWKVYGTEFTNDAIEVCEQKGIIMFKGPINSNWFKKISFDVITSFEVIEHINNPREDMQIISDSLRTGGVFYCTTPNFNSLERRILKANYNIIEYPEHLCYYTKRTLNYLMNEFELKPIWVKTTGISISRIKQGFRSKSDRVTSKKSEDEKIRESMQSSKIVSLLISIINTALQWTNSGNALKGLYIKT